MAKTHNLTPKGDFRQVVPVDVRPYIRKPDGTPRTEWQKSLRHLMTGREDTARAMTQANDQLVRRIRAMIKAKDAPALIRTSAAALQIDLDATVQAVTTAPSATQRQAVESLDSVLSAVLEHVNATVRSAIADMPGEIVGHMLRMRAGASELRRTLAPMTPADLASMTIEQAHRRAHGDKMDATLAGVLDSFAADGAPVLDALGMGASLTDDSPLRVSAILEACLNGTRHKRDVFRKDDVMANKHRARVRDFIKSCGRDMRLDDPGAREAAEQWINARRDAGWKYSECAEGRRHAGHGGTLGGGSRLDRPQPLRRTAAALSARTRATRRRCATPSRKRRPAPSSPT